MKNPSEPTPTDTTHPKLVGGFEPTHLKKNARQIGSSLQVYRGENRIKCLKPPPIPRMFQGTPRYRTPNRQSRDNPPITKDIVFRLLVKVPRGFVPKVC